MMFKFHVSVKTEGAAAVACSALFDIFPRLELERNKLKAESSATPDKNKTLL
jgi:hypothetical protein